MKRHFLTGLKAFAVGVMTLLAVSCYDDSKLWGEVEQIKKDLTALQEKLNQEVNTLNSVIGALEAKVAVVKVEKNAAGNYVLTFSNNETLEISAADANANNTGLVTTVTEGDVTYWAVVGADGTVTKLDAVVHPDTKLSFKVDPETGILFVSYNGNDYESTGVFVNDETTFNVVENFVDAEDYVVITVGGVEYKLPKVSQNYFDIVSGKVFFNFGETKTIPVDMNGVVTSMVAKAPTGWNVKLTDSDLKITAPYGEIDPEWGDIYMANPEDETSGVVELWVVTEDGKTIVGTVAVTLASPSNYAVITVTDNSNVRIDVGQDFVQGEFYYGACKMSDYDPKALFASIADILDYDNMPAGVNRFFDETYGDEPWIETTMADLLGTEITLGDTYVVWGICLEMGFNMETYSRELITTADDFIVKYVTPMSVEFTSEPTWNNAALTIDAKGAESFFATFMDSMTFQMYSDYFTAEGLQAIGMDLFGVLQSATNIGNYYKSYNGSLNTLGYPESELSYAQPLFAGTEYVVVIVPMEPYREKSTYTIEDAVVKTVRTNDLTTGGAGVVKFEAPVSTVTSFTVDAISTATSLTVYQVMTTAEYDALVESLETGETVQDYMMANYSTFDMTADSEFTVRHGNDYSQLIPDTSYTVIAMAIDADGTCGEVVALPVKTLPLPYDETITVSFASVDASTPNQTKVVLDVQGADKVCVYVNRSATYTGLETFVVNNGVNANYYGYQWLTVEDGKATATVNAQYNKNIYAVAYNVADDKVSGISHQIQTVVE
jgi:hypothetical protein